MIPNTTQKPTLTLTTMVSNIPCAESCFYEANGQCLLNYVNAVNSLVGCASNCAYFTPKQPNIAAIAAKPISYSK